jgi:hypothetical protein
VLSLLAFVIYALWLWGLRRKALIWPTGHIRNE